MSSAATAAHGTSFIPNFSRPLFTSGFKSTPHACDTKNVRTSSPRFAPTPVDVNSSVNVDGGSTAPPAAIAADARLNAARCLRNSSLAFITRVDAMTSGSIAPGRHSNTSIRSTLFKYSRSSVFSPAKSARSFRTLATSYDALESFDTAACFAVRNGNRNVVPRYSVRASHPNAMNGAN